MRYKLEKIGCYILIIILLPYIVTVFLNGPVITSSANVQELTVRVENGSIKLKDYAIGLLAREIPATYELEAIKAQAIIIRTRIYKDLHEKGSETTFAEEFWTKSDMEEVWGISEYERYYKKLEKAWDMTEGQVLTYEGELIYTPFFSLSNGSTRDGKEVLGKDYPYLKIKDCPLDIESVKQLQTVTLDLEVKDFDIKVSSIDTAGYVLKVKVGNEEVNGEEFRKNYNLVSSCFTVNEYEGNIRITTRGVGHGIGLSQNTANKKAESGEDAEQILKYFYEGCELQEVADIVITE